MAQYSNVKKPALFIPFMDYQQSIGNIKYQDDELNDIHLLNPTKIHRITETNDWWDDEEIQYDIDFNNTVTYQAISDSNGYIYIFILGHNLKTKDCALEVKLKEAETDSYISAEEQEKIINDDGDSSPPSSNGFSIIKAKYNSTYVTGIRVVIKGYSSESNGEIKLGCVSLCSKWSPPNTPDLNLTISREYDGVETITTKGGATLSNAQYTRGGTFWSSSYAWELISSDYEQSSASIQTQRTLGRRNWSLKFSYINDSDLMPEFESLNYYETGLNDNNNKNILESQSFFSRVLNRVQGSHLPFIFLPNDTDPNYNPDQWSICRFDQQEIDINQLANSVYEINLKIRECW